MMEVAAGIIRRQDGRVLICKRGHGHNAHLWEFPGGKIEAGETPAECLARELMEELSLPVENIQEKCTREAEGIRFVFLEGETAAEPTLLEHEASAFVVPREMLRYDFCPADTAVARALALKEPTVKHFFWDFDGTLMDTYPATVAAFLRAAAGLGISVTAERARTLMMDTLTRCVHIIAAENGLTDDALWAAFHREEKLISVEDAEPISGIPEALRTLKAMGCHHYLATHRDLGALDYLKHAGLDDLFDDHVTAEDGFPRKPAPDMLEYLARKHGLNPAECMMIGDRPLDTEAGRGAGMLSCLLDAENRFPDAPCDMRVCTIPELLEAFTLPV